MATLRELIVKFSLKADTKAIKRFGEALNAAKDAAADLVAWGAKLLITYAAVAGLLARVATGAADFAEEVLRSASAFGLTVQRWQELDFAFQALGASSDDLADALSTLTERAMAAREGAKTYRREFERLGISMADLKGKKPGELLDLYIERAGAMEDVNKRVTASVVLLGDDLGRRIARGITSAGGSFQDYIQILRSVGGVFDEQLLEKAQQGQIQFRLLGAVFSTLRKRIGLELAPVFGMLASKIVTAFVRSADSVDAFVKRLKDGVQREIGRVLLYVKRLDDFVKRNFGGWAGMFAGIASAIAGMGIAFTGLKIAVLLSTLIPLITAIAGLSAAVGVLLLTVGLAAVAIGFLLVALDDLFVEVNGGDSLFRKLIDTFRASGTVIGTFFANQLELTITKFKALIKAAGEFWKEHGPALTKVFKVIGGILVAVLLVAFNALIQLIIDIGRLAIWLADQFIDMAKNTANALAFIIAAFTVLWGILKQLPGALSNFWDQLSLVVNTTIFDPIIAALITLRDLLGSLPSAALKLMAFGSTSPGEAAARDTQALMGVIQGGRQGGGGGEAGARTGGARTVSIKIGTISANSEEEGRAAARGFQKEIESGGFFDSLISIFEPGAV